MKKCRWCAEEIQDDAIICRYCHKRVRGTLFRNILFGILIAGVVVYIFRHNAQIDSMLDSARQFLKDAGELFREIIRFIKNMPKDSLKGLKAIREYKAAIESIK